MKTYVSVLTSLMVAAVFAASCGSSQKVDPSAASRGVPGVLTSIVVVPANSQIGLGDSLQFTAKGYDALNGEVPVNPTWSVDNTRVISLNKKTGTNVNLRGIALGKAKVTVKQGEVSGSTTVEVVKNAPVKVDRRSAK